MNLLENLSPLGNTILIFLINTITLLIILRLVYYRSSSNRDSLFGFFLFGQGIFFVTRFLHSVDMSMGFTFGLFAVFSMLRYRTESISLRDMTYLFMVIVISLLSAVSPVSVLELIALHMLIIAITVVSETNFFAPRISVKKILYDNIQHISPSQRALLIDELTQRTGLGISHLSIESIDYLRDSAEITVFYKN